VRYVQSRTVQTSWKNNYMFLSRQGTEVMKKMLTKTNILFGYNIS